MVGKIFRLSDVPVTNRKGSKAVVKISNNRKPRKDLKEENRSALPVWWTGWLCIVFIPPMMDIVPVLCPLLQLILDILYLAQVLELSFYFWLF